MSKPSTIKQALSAAKKAVKKGDFDLAHQMYQAVLAQQPKHIAALKGMKKLKRKVPQRQAAATNPASPAKDQIDRLLKLYKSGLMAEAETGCQKFLATYPDTLIVLNILGSALQNQGKYQPAIEIFNKMISLAPEDALHYYNRGVTLKGAGNLKLAVEDFKKTVSLKPDYVEAINYLGITLSGLGELKEAEKYYSRAIGIKSDAADYYNNRAAVRELLGKFDEAIDDCKKAIDLNPTLAEPHNIKAGIRFKQGRLHDSLTCYNEAIARNPNFLEALINRANIQNELGLFDHAVISSQKAISIDPNQAQAHYNFGVALFGVGRALEAISRFDKAIELRPNYTEAFSNRGTVFYHLDDMQKAIEDNLKAIELNPNYADAYHKLGNMFKDMGEKEKAIDYLSSAVKIDPGSAFIHRGLSVLKKYSPDDPQIDQMEELVVKTDSQSADRVQLCFALAKAYEDLEEFGKSFAYLKEGNSLRKRHLNYSLAKDLEEIEAIKKNFQEAPPELGLEALNTDDPRMVFILGMPRSGTTLVEQILASHSQVYGAGEVEKLTTLVRNAMATRSAAEKTGNIPRLSKEEIRTISKQYLAYLSGLTFEQKVVTDKMPINFKYIGFIASAMPGAKIIHMVRDPMATCWSNFKHYFSSTGNGFCYDMDDLVLFYKAYRELMVFWQNRYPDRIYNLNYESLTENQEAETRRLLDFCELPWEEGCLEFHKTRRYVKTASATQVKQKIYTGSSNAWKKYDTQLEQMARFLSDNELLTNG
ncbi:MAG: tetratricopeptide repeat protein [Desulfobacterales bacterium]|nr:tetratricopeptide repeat protein [Desulfobacterales bacterium]